MLTGPKDALWQCKFVLDSDMQTRAKSVTEIRIVRWMSGHIRKDKIRNNLSKRILE